MKKQITLFTMMAITASLFFISSCSKKETVTPAPDLTASLVGTYIGTFVDSTIGVDGSTTNYINQVVKITKVDNTHIKFTPTDNTFYTYNAEVVTSGSNYLISIPSQTDNGEAIQGLPLTFNGVSVNGGGYNASLKQYNSLLLVKGTDIQAYQGVKQ